MLLNIYIRQAPTNYNWYLPTMLTKRMYTFSACFIPKFDCFVITGWYNQSSIRRKSATKTFVEAHLVIANVNSIWVILRGKLLEWYKCYLTITSSRTIQSDGSQATKAPIQIQCLKQWGIGPCPKFIVTTLRAFPHCRRTIHAPKAVTKIMPPQVVCTALIVNKTLVLNQKTIFFCSLSGKLLFYLFYSQNNGLLHFLTALNISANNNGHSQSEIYFHKHASIFPFLCDLKF